MDQSFKKGEIRKTPAKIKPPEGGTPTGSDKKDAPPGDTPDRKGWREPPK